MGTRAVGLTAPMHPPAERPTPRFVGQARVASALVRLLLGGQAMHARCPVHSSSLRAADPAGAQSCLRRSSACSAGTSSRVPRRLTFTPQRHSWRSSSRPCGAVMSRRAGRGDGSTSRMWAGCQQRRPAQHVHPAPTPHSAHAGPAPARPAGPLACSTSGTPRRSAIRRRTLAAYRRQSDSSASAFKVGAWMGRRVLRGRSVSGLQRRRGRLPEAGPGAVLAASASPCPRT